MKKVLFISYYWPPSGKASLHWPLKIITHLPKSNWLPIVLTVDEDTFSHKDETIVNKVPKEVKIFKANSYEPFNFIKNLLVKEKKISL